MFNQKRIFKITYIVIITYNNICNFEDSFLVKHTRIRSIQMIYFKELQTFTSGVASTDRNSYIRSWLLGS